MIIGNGVDITENLRFQKLLEDNNEAFFKRIFTEGEREYCNKFRQDSVKAQHYAARFAAKEALVKALGTGFRKMSFHDLEVKNDSSGAPFFLVSGAVEKLVKEQRIEKIHLSISHSDNYSIAFVIVEGKGEV